MSIYIALLRGINVGGNKRIKMADLRELLADIGISDAKTLLASGNVIFQSDETEREKLVSSVEEAIQKHYDFEVKVILRSGDELEAVIEKNPFTGQDVAGNRLLVTFLKNSPSREAVHDFQESHTTKEVLHLMGKEIFIHYPDGAGQSKLSNTVIEKKFAVTGTARNWNTVIKLQAILGSFES